MTGLFQKISDTLPKLDGWCSPEKGQTLAALVLGTHPEVCVEIGVWGGRSALPIALALKEIGRGTLICIDPWSNAASAEGQVNVQDAEWWGKVADHETVYNRFLNTIAEHGIGQCVRVVRQRSDQVPVPANIDLLHIDGNHSDQAVKDVERFAPNVRAGGFVCCDDLDWSGGGVRRAVAKLQSMGFREIYRLGTGAMFQRAHA